MSLLTVGILLYLLVGFLDGIWFTFDFRKTEFNRVTRILGIIIATFFWLPLFVLAQTLRLIDSRHKI